MCHSKLFNLFLLNSIKIYTVLFAFMALSNTAFCQELNPVQWKFSVNEQQKIIAEAKIDSGWYLYSQIQQEDGSVATQFYIENEDGTLEHTFASRNAPYLVNDYNEMFQSKLSKFYKEVTFEIQALSTQNLNGYVEFMCCDNTKCLPPKKINFNLNKKQ